MLSLVQWNRHLSPASRGSLQTEKGDLKKNCQSERQKIIIEGEKSLTRPIGFRLCRARKSIGRKRPGGDFSLAVGLLVFDAQLQKGIVHPFSLIELRDPKIVSEIDTMMSFQYFSK